MFIVSIILLDENHANGKLRGRKIKEIITIVIGGGKRSGVRVRDNFKASKPLLAMVSQMNSESFFNSHVNP
jgi:hypothetical protein